MATNSKFGYLRDRVVNAWWMLREGRFGDMAKAAAAEYQMRMQIRRDRRNVQIMAEPPAEGEERRDSEYENKRNVRPPSYRPTGAVAVPAPQLTVDREVVAADLASILGSIKVPEAVDEEVSS